MNKKDILLNILPVALISTLILRGLPEPWSTFAYIITGGYIPMLVYLLSGVYFLVINYYIIKKTPAKSFVRALIGETVILAIYILVCLLTGAFDDGYIIILWILAIYKYTVLTVSWSILYIVTRRKKAKKAELKVSNTEVSEE